MTTPRRLLDEALALGERERASLALSLLDSLSPPDLRDEDARLDEIERRARRALSGEEPGVDADEALDAIARDLGV